MITITLMEKIFILVWSALWRSVYFMNLDCMSCIYISYVNSIPRDFTIGVHFVTPLFQCCQCIKMSIVYVHIRLDGYLDDISSLCIDLAVRQSPVVLYNLSGNLSWTSNCDDKRQKQCMTVVFYVCLDTGHLRPSLQPTVPVWFTVAYKMVQWLFIENTSILNVTLCLLMNVSECVSEIIVLFLKYWSWWSFQ